VTVKLGLDLESLCPDAKNLAPAATIEAARNVLDEPTGEARWTDRVRRVLLKAIEKTEGRRA